MTLMFMYKLMDINEYRKQFGKVVCEQVGGYNIMTKNKSSKNARSDNYNCGPKAALVLFGILGGHIEEWKGIGPDIDFWQCYFEYPYLKDGQLHFPTPDIFLYLSHVYQDKLVTKRRLMELCNSNNNVHRSGDEEDEQWEKAALMAADAAKRRVESMERQGQPLTQQPSMLERLVAEPVAEKRKVVRKAALLETKMLAKERNERAEKAKLMKEKKERKRHRQEKKLGL